MDSDNKDMEESIRMSVCNLLKNVCIKGCQICHKGDIEKVDSNRQYLQAQMVNCHLKCWYKWDMVTNHTVMVWRPGPDLDQTSTGPNLDRTLTDLDLTWPGPELDNTSGILPHIYLGFLYDKFDIPGCWHFEKGAAHVSDHVHHGQASSMCLAVSEYKKRS